MANDTATGDGAHAAVPFPLFDREKKKLFFVERRRPTSSAYSVRHVGRKYRFLERNVPHPPGGLSDWPTGWLPPPTACALTPWCQKSLDCGSRPTINPSLSRRSRLLQHSAVHDRCFFDQPCRAFPPKSLSQLPCSMSVHPSIHPPPRCDGTFRFRNPSNPIQAKPNRTIASRCTGWIDGLMEGRRGERPSRAAVAAGTRSGRVTFISP